MALAPDLSLPTDHSANVILQDEILKTFWTCSVNCISISSSGRTGKFSRTAGNGRLDAYLLNGRECEFFVAIHTCGACPMDPATSERALIRDLVRKSHWPI
jgi:hypothetical protein